MAALVSSLFSGVKTNAALSHLIRLISVLLRFVQRADMGVHVRGLSCYNNPNRLTGGGAEAEGGGPRRWCTGKTRTNQQV